LSVANPMSSKKKALTLLTLTLLITTTTAGMLLIDSTAANPLCTYEQLPRININADGTITPNDTSYISRNGNTYTLTADITDQYVIFIWCNNIVFDGQGHTIRITIANCYDYNVLRDVNNVTVKNLQVYNNGNTAIGLADCNNCKIANVTSRNGIAVSGKNNMVTQCRGSVALNGGSENLIFRNNITYIFVSGSSSNRFYENNILLSGGPDVCSDNFWDNGSVGNYWSDYQAKYPNASEVDNTGIGDAPNVIDQNNIDHYPLIYPVNIEDGTIALATRDAQSDQFLTASVTGAAIVLIIVAIVCLMLYRRKKAFRQRKVEKVA
jgi:hypothetical protein